MKRLIAVFMLILLLASAFSGCADNETDEPRNTDEAPVSTEDASADQKITEPPENTPISSPDLTEAPETADDGIPADRRVKEEYLNLTVRVVDYSDDNAENEKEDRVRVQGLEVKPVYPSEEEIEALLENAVDSGDWISFPRVLKGTGYDLFYDQDDDLYGVRKYDGEEVLWEKRYDWDVATPSEYEDVLISKAMIDKGHFCFNAVVLLDAEGEILWYRKVFDEAGIVNCNIVDLIIGDDGSIAAFGTYGEDRDDLFFCKYSLTGDLLAENRSSVGGMTHLLAAAPCGDGYALVCANYIGEFVGSPDIVFTDSEGNIKKTVSLDFEGYEFTFLDLIEHGGLVYLSGHAIKDSGSDELSPLRTYLFKSGSDGKPNCETISDKKLNELAEDYCLGVLIAIDPENGTPIRYTAVKGDFGKELKTEDGELVWRVSNTMFTNFWAGSGNTEFQMIGRMDEYSFNAEGELNAIAKTDETSVVLVG